MMLWQVNVNPFGYCGEGSEQGQVCGGLYMLVVLVPSTFVAVNSMLSSFP